MPLMDLGQVAPPAYSGGAGTTQCTDPDTGDLVICPPGTQCDPQGSGQCIGTPTAATACPVGVNLTTIGQSCQCPLGYEYDANLNQCTPGIIGVYSSSPGSAQSAAALAALAASTTTTTDSTTNILLLLAIAAAAVYFFMEK
jgi:hypothetical protein